nr:MAG TPA: hypothetical protein [Caudoviricetes sp.]
MRNVSFYFGVLCVAFGERAVYGAARCKNFFLFIRNTQHGLLLRSG